MDGDDYQKVLDRIFFVSEKLIVFDRADDLFDHLIKTSISLTMADAATIRVFNVEKGTLDIAMGYGLSDGFLSQPALRIGEGITGRVVLEGKPFSTDDVTQVPHCVNKELARLEGIKALICVPLKSKEGSSGCITAYKKQASAFAEHDLLLLSIFATQAAQAVEKTSLLRDLQRQVTYDQLTGIYNKKAVLKFLDEQVNLSNRHGQSTSIIFLDIDNFKIFNDTHGHLLGDKLLSDFARVLKGRCRKSDVIGRYGGEEFVVIASQTSKENTNVLCTKLREAMKKYKFIGSSGGNVQVTFSAGISSFPEDGSSVDELLKKADEAMYKSKMSGKDAITLCGMQSPVTMDIKPAQLK